ncbi:MAG: carbohydrate-binding family 9-like protein [Planctomycetota bacterium]
MSTARRYICHRAGGPIEIDADLEKAVWRDVAWTEDYVDIEGDARPRPTWRTRHKMLWDEKCLYMLAEMEEPHVWASLTEHDSIVYHDNDWEAFVGPEGSNHNYYELEINALGTVFDLWLPKPYREGVRADHDWNVSGLRKAVRVHGTLNDPSDTDRGWVVELAWPWEAFDRHDRDVAPVPPRDGDVWRMNFSRVQWDLEVVEGRYRKVAGRPEHNWVWSAQGMVDMHQPERWGCVQFSERRADEGAPAFREDETRDAREVLMALYRAQVEHRRSAGSWGSPGELSGGTWVWGSDEGELEFALTSEGWAARTRVETTCGPVLVHCRQDSLLWVEPVKGA